VKFQIICASNIKRHLSAVLNRAALGDEIIITRYGNPIAQLMPYKASSASRSNAWDRLISMLKKGLPLGGEKFNRDELYDR